MLNAEVQRLIANLAKKVTVFEINAARAQVRVKDDAGFESGFVPWFATRSGKTNAWSPPDLGEQGVLLAMGGDPAQGVFIPGLYSDQFKSPDADTNLDSLDCDGDFKLTAGGNIDLTAKGNVTVNGTRIDLN